MPDPAPSATSPARPRARPAPGARHPASGSRHTMPEECRCCPALPVIPSLPVQTGDIGNRCAGTWVTPDAACWGRKEAPRMPWQEQSRMDVAPGVRELARQEGTNVRELCRRYEISAKTGYKWLGRAAAAGDGGVGRPVAPPAARRRPRRRRPSRSGSWRCAGRTRPGAGARSTTALHARGWPTSRRRARSPPSCAATTCSPPTRRRPARRGSASSAPRPTTCGSSTSWATAPSRTVSGCTR